jgi:hypothetical protein
MIELSLSSAAKTDVDTADLSTFLSQFTGGSHQFILYRNQPTQAMIGGKLRKVSGHLATFSEPPTIEMVGESFGGGKFEVKIHGPTAGQNQHRIITSRKFEIAGDPKLPPEALVADAPAPAPEADVLRGVIETLQEDKRRAEETLERERAERQGSRANADRIEARLNSIEEARRTKEATLTRELDRRDREIASLRQQVNERANATTESDLLRLTFGRNTEDMNRLVESHRAELQAERERNGREVAAANERAAREVAAANERAAREVSQANERAARELTAVTDRAARDLDQARRDRESDIQLLDRMHKSETESLRSLHGQLVTTKDAEIARLNETLREVRAQKERDIVDDLDRLNRVKAAASAFAGVKDDDDEDDDRGGFSLGDFLKQASPIFEHFKKPSAPTAPPPAPAPFPTPGYAPMPYVFTQAAPTMRRPISPQQQPRRPMVQATPRARSTPAIQPRPLTNPAPATHPIPAHPGSANAPQTEAPPPALSTVDNGAVGDLAQGLALLEAAYNQHEAPNKVAETIRSHFSKGIIDQLVSVGASRIGDQIARANPDSLLASPGGRRFIVDILEALGSKLTA